jgi:hypothetical protein
LTSASHWPAFFRSITWRLARAEKAHVALAVLELRILDQKLKDASEE